MDFKILYTEPALADLEAVMHWSWEKHPGASERFGGSLLSHVDLLKNFPYLGAPVKGFRGVRRLLHSPVQVYYRVDEGRTRIQILHIRHVAQLFPGSS